MAEPYWWPTDYFESRDRFTALAEECGAHLESRPIEALGPQGESLSVDIASFTADTDENLIILTSGVHGVEGYIGACIQIQALQMILQEGLPERVGIIMIHAVNPWGFAHLRRVDNHNVDINRNFIIDTDSAAVSPPYYATLNPVINLERTPSLLGELQYWFSACALIMRNRGVAKLFKTIAEGQFEFPQGVFFGGKHSVESCVLLQNLLIDLTKKSNRITILDLHSGLGASGTAMLIGNSNRVSPERTLSWIRDHYEQTVYIDSNAGNAYNAKRTFSQWCKHALGHKSYLFLCVEIGTVNPLKLFSALRRENQAHHWADTNSLPYAQTKQTLLNVFAPESQKWRNKSVAQGLKILSRTIELIQQDRSRNCS